MTELKKEYVRVKKHGGGFRLSVPAYLVKKLILKHNSLVDISQLKKVDEKKLNEAFLNSSFKD